jgi:hypothetical protein
MIFAFGIFNRGANVQNWGMTEKITTKLKQFGGGFPIVFFIEIENGLVFYQAVSHR